MMPLLSAADYAADIYMTLMPLKKMLLMLYYYALFLPYDMLPR